MIPLVLLAVALGTANADSTRAGKEPTSWRPLEAESAYEPVTNDSAPTKAWNALANYGLDLRVRGAAVDGENLYLGGRFTESGDGSVTDLGHIARYDTGARKWKALPNQGLNGEVIALALVAGDLYAGGWFTQTVDEAAQNLGHIAHYDISADSWEALPKEGLNDFIFALTSVGDDLYAGGLFTQSGDGSVTDLNRIARYDTAGGTWQALDNHGLNGSVYVLATAGSDLYAGGGFSQTADGGVTVLGNIAHYDTETGTWHPLANGGLNNTVNALQASGSDVYIGGAFEQTADGTVGGLNHIARYDTDTGTWHPLANGGVDDIVFALAVVGKDLYVGGAFDQTTDGSATDLGHIARYDTETESWHELPNQGLSNWVYVLTAIEDDLYVGGEFNMPGDYLMPGLGHIARYGLPDPRIYLPLVVKE
jgi:N-acetylneuraminic acid mutarotase